MATVEQLQQVILEQSTRLQELAEQNRELQRENEEKLEAIAAAEREKARLESELAVLLNRIFRRRSERLDPNQLRLFADELLSSEPPSPLPMPERIPTTPRRPGHGRKAFPEHLPREEVVLDLAEDQKTCDCGQTLRRIGEEVTERGHIVPARIIVRRYVRPKYACPGGHTVRTAAVPPSLIDRAKYEPSVYAYLATAKYADHLPLHRLEGIFRRHGVEMPRSTMWEMLSRLDEVVAQPIVEQMRREILMEPVLQADETPVTVQLEPKGGSKQAYLWCYGHGIRRVFDFTMSRGRDGPRRFLGDWKGTLQTDGYPGYDPVTRENGLIRAGCWAHARRKLKEAMEAGQTAAARVLLPIQRLFRIEAALKQRAKQRQLDPEAFHELRHRFRERRSQPVLRTIEQAAEALRRDRATVPRGVLGRALRYLENQWLPLTRCLEDPRLDIHNNDTERVLRHVAVGRKNWLFFGSPRGGEVGRSLFTLALACRAVDVNPARYFTDVIERIDTTPASRIHQLTPWGWAMQNFPAR